ncbi:SMEK domain-containing protein [Teredinibacter turnerae]|uniref:SMEK domain-containing protein n=1 Tax=Teredinibacter turnerae TaxID=2426 RepID=UPI0003818682|nr:SMEK domain-containing protein [Teredinibacter turnerae]
MRQEELDQKISKLISRFMAEIKAAKAQGRLDTAITSENAWIPILKIVFKCPDLINLNTKKKHFPAVDLGDYNTKTSFQVSSRNDQAKITETLRLFSKNDLKEHFVKVIVFFLVEKKASYSQQKCDEAIENKIDFNTEEHIVDPLILISKIKDLSLKEQESILHELIHMMDGPGAVDAYKAARETSLTPSQQLPLFQERACWTHETTNDERYVSRPEHLNYFQKWIDDNKIRAIAITGIGGTGKTSLVGNWLKSKEYSITRPSEGLFFWSFYVKRDVPEFIKCLCEYFESICDVEFQTTPKPDKNRSQKMSNKIGRAFQEDPKDILEIFLEKFHLLPPIILILDGLEVLQEALKEGESFGAFIEAMLRDLILHITHAEKPWLCVTTSRFPLTDIAHKKQVKERIIKGLTTKEGADLLHRRRVYGDTQDRENISKYFEGHPFALLIFSASLPSTQRDTPMVHFNAISEGLNASIFADKLSRLMMFYKNNIDNVQYNIISALSMFRSPIMPGTLIELSKKFSRRDDYYFDIDDHIDSTIYLEINKLVDLGLIILDQADNEDVYGCHPIMREFFSNSALESDSYRGHIVTNFLVNQPDSAGIIGASEIEKYKVSIEVLLKIGDIYQAERLYRDRLDHGRIFITLGIPKEAKQVYQQFLDYFNDNSSGNKKYEPRVIADYLNPYIEFCIELAEYERAEELIDISSRSKTQVICRIWKARICFNKCEYAESINHCSYSIRAQSPKVTRNNGKAEIIAICYYLLIKCLVAQGFYGKAKNELEKLKIHSKHFDQKIADGEIVPFLCQLIIGTKLNDKEMMRLSINKCKSRIERVGNAYFQLDIKLHVAEAHLARGEIVECLKLSKDVYSKAVKESFPYHLCWAAIIVEKAYFFKNGIISKNKITEVMDMSKANFHWYLTIESILLLVSSNCLVESEATSLKDEARTLGNRSGIKLKLV